MAHNGLGLCDALAFEKLSLNKQMKMSRNNTVHDLHNSKGIAKPMLCVVAVMFCFIAQLLTCCPVYLCFGAAEVKQ